MSRKPQLDFFQNHSLFAPRKEHGGASLKSNPKTKRPLSTKDSLHVVLKSSYRPQIISFRKEKYLKQIQKLLIEKARHFRVSLERQSINSNHIHLLIKVKSRKDFNSFLRTITAMIPRIVGEAKKGSPSLYKNLWEARPFSRIISWGQEKLRVAHYIERNFFEAIGFIAYTARRKSRTRIRTKTTHGAQSTA